MKDYCRNNNKSNNSKELQQYSINENQNCDEKDLDQTNCIENSFINENVQLFETINLSKIDYDVDMFLIKMSEYPCIWDTSLTSYHDQIIRKNIWDELSKKFGCPLLTIIIDEYRFFIDFVQIFQIDSDSSDIRLLIKL